MFYAAVPTALLSLITLRLLPIKIANNNNGQLALFLFLLLRFLSRELNNQKKIAQVLAQVKRVCLMGNWAWLPATTFLSRTALALFATQLAAEKIKIHSFQCQCHKS